MPISQTAAALWPSNGYEFSRTGTAREVMVNIPIPQNKTLLPTTHGSRNIGSAKTQKVGIIDNRFLVRPNIKCFSIEGIALKIGRLRNGWAGGESVSPSNGVHRDLTALASILPANISIPDVEVDPDDGNVTLMWVGDDDYKCFGLIIRGNGFVSGIAPLRASYRTWRISLKDETFLLKRLEGNDALGCYYS